MVRPAKMVVETGAQVAGEGQYDKIAGTPWANLGHPIPAGASVDEMLVAAGLDWRVLRGENTVRITLEDDRTIVKPNPKSFALVRDTDLEILSPHVGPRYKHIQNDDAFEVFAEFVAAGSMTMETAGSFKKGQHIWGLARTGHGFELADGERIESYFLLLQSHRYGYALKAMWTPIRYPGGHTLVQSINQKGLGGSVNQTYSLSHASKFDAKRLQEIKEVVGIAARAMDDFKGKAEFMARARLSMQDAILYLVQVFDPQLPGRIETRGEKMPTTFAEIDASTAPNRNLKKVARMLAQSYVEGEGTAWKCWSTTQHAYDHEMGHNENTHLESIWLGKNRDAKVRAFNLANVMATSHGRT